MTESRVVIVTGGGTGIGAATARQLSTSGHHVVISGRRPEPLRRVAGETGALAHPADAGDPAEVAGLVDGGPGTPGPHRRRGKKPRGRGGGGRGGPSPRGGGPP
ncbi:SDR family NAD(P)-dependent oxidoreductase, partial [Streptomyces sp. NPDC058257]|uniref:SDR family NAD(P)-dependent oxidoreductase n=1 Tax=Streptomyces sp. NPDC058257 TaxID=3346409 RepID=UPI0036EF7208